MKNQEVQLLINTPSGKKPRQDEIKMRTNAYLHGTPIITTAQGTLAAADGIEALIKGKFDIKAIQDYHADIN
jgi:carbamoyl-phosphate synthase large subunit